MNGMILMICKYGYNFSIVHFDSYLYPTKLKSLSDCPFLLFVLGDVSILNDVSIAIVGSRKCSEYGRDVTAKFALGLSNTGVRIVSGLADGIDSVAHLSSVNNKTVAVVACGFDYILSGSKSNLVNEILSNGGAIVSEYFPDVHPTKFSFLKRNRLIAALSDGVIVTEARKNSGALATADYAKKLNRKLFVVPSNITNSKAIGSNGLIVNGATCVFSLEDVFKFFPAKCFSTINFSKEVVIPKEYENFYNLLKTSPISSNEIARILNIPVNVVNSTLTFMQLDGYVKELPGKVFSLNT